MARVKIKKAVDVGVSRACGNCGTTSTPLWRKPPPDISFQRICNACGLYYKSRGKMRPAKLAYRNNSSMGSTRPHESSSRCFNCHTRQTPLWRRDAVGRSICNACGLYLKNNGKHRPVNLGKSGIHKRQQGVVSAGAIPDPSDPSSASTGLEKVRVDFLLNHTCNG